MDSMLSDIVVGKAVEKAVILTLIWGGIAFCFMAMVANWRRDDMPKCKGKKKGKK